MSERSLQIEKSRNKRKGQKVAEGKYFHKQKSLAKLITLRGHQQEDFPLILWIIVILSSCRSVLTALGFIADVR